MRMKLPKLAPVIATLLLAAAIGAEHLARPRPGDADPFHARVYAALATVPKEFDGWTSTDEPIDEAAITLLQPNATLQRVFTHHETGMRFVFLLVQCRTARDMGGHYPPVCYSGRGYERVLTQPGTWPVAGSDMAIPGVDYGFHKYFEGRSENLVIRNLIIMPDGRYAQDITQVRSAAADYMRQYYGAAQIQLVFNADHVPATERDAIFSRLMAELKPLLDALTSGGKR